MPSESARASLHVYNARCALTVEPVRNRRGDLHTLNLESAARAAGGEGFDWERKLIVQLTREELPEVLAVLLGRLAETEHRFHGPRRDKGFACRLDGERVVVQLFAAEASRHTVVLGRADRLGVAAMLFRQLQRNHGGLSAEVLEAMHAAIYAGGER